jgi:hypothetical protein
MSNFTFNIALGRVAELYNRVKSNDPANSALVIVAIETAATDATLRDLDTLAAVLADGDTAEVTNSGYARVVLDQDDLNAIAPDDGNDRMDLDIPDQTWEAVEAGDDWTDILICYDPDTTTGDDSTIIPLTLHDFEVTPDGSDIQATVNSAGFYRAAPA